MYSLQSSFIKPVIAGSKEKVTFRVDRTADGRSFATRHVRTFQGSVCVHLATISFHNTTAPVGPILQYQVSPPKIDISPEDIPAEAVDKFNASLISQSVPLLKHKTDEMPFDWRIVGMEMTGNATDARLRAFVRSRPLSSERPSLHLAAFVYLSDQWGFGVALAANPKAVGRGMHNVAFGASLTHNLTFHDSRVKVDDWLIVERETSWGGEGRVLVHQKVWDVKTGRLVMSGTQEAVVRLKESKL